MAKKYAFTRTLVVNHVTAMTCDKVTAEVENFTFDVAGSIPNDKALKRIAQTQAEENKVVVDIVDVITDKKVLGITEEDFLKNAVQLDPKTRKPII